MRKCCPFSHKTAPTAASGAEISASKEQRAHTHTTFFFKTFLKMWRMVITPPSHPEQNATQVFRSGWLPSPIMIDDSSWLSSFVCLCVCVCVVPHTLLIKSPSLLKLPSSFTENTYMYSHENTQTSIINELAVPSCCLYKQIPPAVKKAAASIPSQVTHWSCQTDWMKTIPIKGSFDLKSQWTRWKGKKKH